jgi:hypothetical protein
LEAVVSPEEWVKTLTAAGTVNHSQVIQVVMVEVQEVLPGAQVPAEAVEEPQL